jgi:hypothetical protein
MVIEEEKKMAWHPYMEENQSSSKTLYSYKGMHDS